MDAHSVTSDHSLISFLLIDDFIAVRPTIRRRYKDKNIDAACLQNKIEEYLNKMTCDIESSTLSHEVGPKPTTWDVKATRLTEAIIYACDKVLAKTNRSKVAFPPWWNADIHSSRQEV
ncbi:Uncharacterized protein FWK35_00029319 [Aphis craccivora]|uniref:Uncharacterized protein n=1 Tax=Aphis craccivora TaxID=307492 RepID=A0A6G0VYW6_APHCR|nr:Uncharacterized protein FWK35_00029319 [Aphis craccivora]